MKSQIVLTATNHIKESAIYTGLTNFLNDFLTVLLIVSASVTIICMIIQLIKGQMANPEEAPRVLKHAKTIMVIGIIIFLVSALFKLILNKYFGINVDPGTVI